jgi:hypothetical protein
MNKLLFTITAMAGAALLGLAGCSKTSSDFGGAAALDTSKLQAAFAAVSSVDKVEIEKAISAIKSGDYAGGVASLKTAAANLKLSPEQQQSIKELLAQAQARLGAAAGQAMDKATDAAGDLQKAGGN